MPSYALGDVADGPAYMRGEGGGPAPAVDADCPGECCDGCPLWRRIHRCFSLIDKWICETSTCGGGRPIEPGDVLFFQACCWIVTPETNPDPPEEDRIFVTGFLCVDATDCNDAPCTFIEDIPCCASEEKCGLKVNVDGDAPVASDVAGTLEYAGIASCTDSSEVSMGLAAPAPVRHSTAGRIRCPGQFCETDFSTEFYDLVPGIDCCPAPSLVVGGITACVVRGGEDTVGSVVVLAVGPVCAAPRRDLLLLPFQGDIMIEVVLDAHTGAVRDVIVTFINPWADMQGACQGVVTCEFADSVVVASRRNHLCATEFLLDVTYTMHWVVGCGACEPTHRASGDITLSYRHTISLPTSMQCHRRPCLDPLGPAGSARFEKRGTAPVIGTREMAERVLAPAGIRTGAGDFL